MGSPRSTTEGAAAMPPPFARPLACLRSAGSPSAGEATDSAYHRRLAAAAARADDGVFVVGAPATLGGETTAAAAAMAAPTTLGESPLTSPHDPPARGPPSAPRAAAGPARDRPSPAPLGAASPVPFPAIQAAVPYGDCPAADIFVLVGNTGRSLAADMTACLASLRSGTYAVTEAHLGVLHARWVHVARHHRVFLSLAAGWWAEWVEAAASPPLNSALQRLAAAAASANAAWAAFATAHDAAALLPRLWAALAEAITAGAAAATAAEGILPAVVAATAKNTGDKQRGRQRASGRPRSRGRRSVVRTAGAAEAAAVAAATAAHGPTDAVHLLCRGVPAAARPAVAARLARHAGAAAAARRRRPREQPEQVDELDGGRGWGRRRAHREAAVAAAAGREWEDRQAGALRFLANAARGGGGGVRARARAGVPPLALVAALRGGRGARDRQGCRASFARLRGCHVLSAGTSVHIAGLSWLNW